MNNDEPRRNVASVAFGSKTTVVPSTIITTVRRLQQRLQCEGDRFQDSINDFGYPWCYACRTRPEEETNYVTVHYDYELVWVPSGAPGEDFAQTILPYIDWGRLDQVASDLHLRSCESITRRQDFDDFTITGVYGDTPSFRDLFVPRCEYLAVEEGEDAQCAPIRGTMTASYVGSSNSADAVEQALLTVISNVMSENRGTKKPFHQVLYLGDRATYNSRAGPSFATTSEDNDSVRNTSIAAGVAAVAVIIVLAGAALFVSRRRKPRQEMAIIRGPPSDIEMPAPKAPLVLDAEVPSSPTNETANTSTTLVVGIDKKQLEETPDHLVDLDDVQNGDADNSSTDAVAEEPVDVDQVLAQPEKDSIVSAATAALPSASGRSTPPPDIAACSSSSSEDSMNKAMFLPSTALPMVKSETLKKRRKKKKMKKQKVTLTKVNSRENIASMETISETDEQEQQDELDDDCQPNMVPTYSTSDDDSSAYSSSPSDNEGEADLTSPVTPKTAVVSPSPFRRKDLPPLPPAEF